MGVRETLKEIVSQVEGIDNLALTRQVLKLQTEVIELLEQSRQKDELIRKLEEGSKSPETIVLKGFAYYAADKGDKLVDGPFCTRCYDVDHVKNRIADLGGPDAECMVCRTHFGKSEIQFDLSGQS